MRFSGFICIELGFFTSCFFFLSLGDLSWVPFEALRKQKYTSVYYFLRTEVLLLLFESVI